MSQNENDPDSVAFQRQYVKDTDVWCTPLWLASSLGNFTLDPCSNPHSYVDSAASYSLEDNQNGLVMPWWGRVFVNPPYSRVFPWAKKALIERSKVKDLEVVFLLKLDPTVGWFKHLMMGGARYFPLKNRIAFDRPGMKSIKPQWPCVLITLGSHLLPKRMDLHIWRSV